MLPPALIVSGGMRKNEYFPFGYTCDSYKVNLIGNYTK